MRADYRRWLEDQQYGSGTVAAQLHRAGRVEDCYGNLDDHFSRDRLRSVLADLTYSTEDERRNRSNPSKIPFEGNIRNNLASYRNAITRYIRFLAGKAGEVDDEFVHAPAEDARTPDTPAVGQEDTYSAQKLSLERDMQAALRRDIVKLGGALSIADDGAKRSVETGFIDITCDDSVDGALVAIELKAGKADARAIAQLLGYMGDLGLEEPSRTIRGILVAYDFDKRTVSAARASGILLKRYAIEFRFESVE